MSKIHFKEIMLLLRSLLLGLTAFIISGILTFLLTLNPYGFYGVFYIIINGSLCGLFLALFLKMRQKIGRMILACIVAWLISYFTGNTFIDFIYQLFFTSFHILYEVRGLFDTYIFILMGVVFVTTFGAIVFGQKSVLLFAVTGGIISIPFVFINMGFIDIWLKRLVLIFDKTEIPLLLMFNMSFGISVGLSIGLYKMFINSDGN